MDKMRIEIRQKEKNIAAMRKLDSKAGDCKHCYYYIRKRTKTTANKKKDESEAAEPKKEIVVLENYCCNYKASSHEAKENCSGCWIYDHE